MILKGNKNAISPLIATVLLIAFAVALGAVVMSWGRGYVEDTAAQSQSQSGSQIECSMNSNIAFFKNAQGRKWVCNSTATNYTFVIQNTGNTEFTGLKIVAIGDEINQTEMDVTIKPGSVYKGSFEYTGTNITRVMINPILVYQGERKVCTTPSANAVESEIYEC